MAWGRDDEQRLGIGEFSQLSGLSIDMLRRYHDAGLLVPAEVLPSGYRRYGLGQVARAWAIASLRALDLPLDEVSAVLGAADDRVRFEVLHRHRVRLTEQLRAATRRLEQLDRLINEEASMANGVDDELRTELLAMFEEQQGLGRRLFEETRAARPDRFLFELAPADRPAAYDELARQSHEHAIRLDAIVDKVGWPGASVAGDDGAAAAWAIAQHADEDLDLGRRWLPLLRQAVAAGEVPPMHFAALADRVRLRDREPQVFGTVVEPDGGIDGWRLRGPVEDEAGLDGRRADLGLEPVREFLGSLPSPDAWYESESA